MALSKARQKLVDFKRTDVLRMILETMFRVMAFDRIIVCMRDAKTHVKAEMPDLFGRGERERCRRQDQRCVRGPYRAAPAD